MYINVIRLGFDHKIHSYVQGCGVGVVESEPVKKVTIPTSGDILIL